MDTPNRPRLDSWKDIARYLGRDVSTVFRWERDRGLPVHRVPGGKLSRVFAYREELDEWLAQSEIELAPHPGETSSLATNGDLAAPGSDVPGRQPAEPGAPVLESARRRYLPTAVAVAVLGIATLAVALTIARETTGGVAELVVRRTELHAIDKSGRTRWTYPFDATALAPGSGRRWSQVADLDGDRRDDVLAIVQVFPRASTEHVDTLLRFGQGGTVGWISIPNDRVRFREGEYGPPWASNDMLVYRAGGEQRIAWAVHQYTWWPGLLITLNARGERLGTFVNSGWIGSVAQTHDGRRLLLTGINNLRRAYFLAVLDAERPAGHSPEPPGAPTECPTCPSGTPLAYYIFPYTDVTYTPVDPASAPSVQMYEDGSILVRVHENGGPNIAETIYELAPDASIRGARFSDSFWEWHQRLEREGKLNHPARDCPERRGLDVQSWTPAAGWKSERVSVQ